MSAHLLLDPDALSFLVGEDAIGERRLLDEAAVTTLSEFARR